MIISRQDNNDERRVLIGMIVDSSTVANISDRWDGEMFHSQWSNLIGKWCVEYFRKYGKPPKRSIEGLFAAWSQKAKDKDTIALCDKFLGSLSDEYGRAKEINSQYLIDCAGRLFNRVRINKMIESLQGQLDSGNVNEAITQVEAFNKIELGSEAAVDIFKDQTALQEAFEKSTECLIKYPGALKTFFGNHLARDSFITFMGAEKRGKTFWLIDMAWRSVVQRNKTAFFAVGDMSQSQMLRRLATRASKRPLDARKYPYPIGLIKDPDADFAEPTHEHRETTDILEWQAAWKSLQKITKTKIKSDETYFKLSTHPNDSINVQGIRNVLNGWERNDGFVPSVVVIDYADILAPPPNSGEGRDQTNATWKQLRRLSQELHCLVVTATQADAASYSADTISRKNFSEDKRKLAHCTGMVGLNATAPEEERNLMRLNWVVLREGAFSASKCVHVATCFDICNPAVLSTW
jgi:hypothetical protein